MVTYIEYATAGAPFKLLPWHESSCRVLSGILKATFTFKSLELFGGHTKIIILSVCVEYLLFGNHLVEHGGLYFNQFFLRSH